MDALSQIIELIRLKAVVYTRVTFAAPWGVDVPAGPHAQFRLIVDGTCVLNTGPGNLLTLRAGDLIFFPHGAAHWLADTPESPRMGGTELLAAIRAGQPFFTGPGAPTTMISGHVEVDRSANHPFIAALPPFIHITDTQRQELSWLEQTSDFILDEVRANRMGSQLIVNRLAEVLCIHTIRAYVEQTKAETGFLRALQDASISNVLNVIHAHPERNWTLADFAKEAGLSRTLLANRFRSLVGETPIGYLTTWRMLRAKELLTTQPEPIHEIAQRVGYQSEAAFNRVFKKRVNQTPAVYRRLAGRSRT